MKAETNHMKGDLVTFVLETSWGLKQTVDISYRGLAPVHHVLDTVIISFPK